MRHKVAEVRAVAAVLDGEAEDAEDMARQVLDTLAELRQGQSLFWVTPRQRNTPYYVSYGPYTTLKRAVTMGQRHFGDQDVHFVVTRTYAQDL